MAFMVVGTVLLAGCGKEDSQAGHDDDGSVGAPMGAVLLADGDQASCPMMGGAINKSLYVDHDGKRVYVCCNDCLAGVTKDPAKFISKLEAEGVTLATVAAEE